MRSYSDFAPLGGRVTCDRDTSANVITWHIKYRDGKEYTFVFPILGPDSNVKARDIWCAKEPGKVWRNWMVDGATPPKAMEPLLS